MSAILSVVSALCFVAVSYAQSNTPCTTPPQWESTLFVDDYELSYLQLSRFTYDAINQRWRVIDEVRVGNASARYFDVLFLYNEGKSYVFDLQSKKCNVTALSPDDKFPTIGVPEGATSLGDAYVGAAFEGVLASFWQFHGTNKYGDYTWYGEFTSRSCLPVREIISSKATGRIAKS